MNSQPFFKDPHRPHNVSLSSLFKCIIENKQLIMQMAKREIIGRYKGSFMGLAWSFFNPLVMLVVYTFVFSEIFKSRWHGQSIEESKTQFATILFIGLILLNLFSEILNRSPTLILANVNYVKKVIFPIEILPIVAMMTALFHTCVSLVVLLTAMALLNGFLPWTCILLPVVIAPLIILVIGFSWMIASLGVFLRDVSQSVNIVTTLSMFLSPVFYPISAVPERLQKYMMFNPPTFIIEQSREVLIWGHMPDWGGLFIYLVISVLVAWCGFIWFQKTRKGFADVL